MAREVLHHVFLFYFTQASFYHGNILHLFIIFIIFFFFSSYLSSSSSFHHLYLLPHMTRLYSISTFKMNEKFFLSSKFYIKTVQKFHCSSSPNIMLKTIYAKLHSCFNLKLLIFYIWILYLLHELYDLMYLWILSKSLMSIC